jgi:hypothetical protein
MNAAARPRPMPQAARAADGADWRGIAAAGAIAAILCDLLHESAHAAAALLPLGVEPLAISTIGTTTAGSSALVALAGPLANLLLATTLLLARSPRLAPATRYFAWLFGTMNLFGAVAYLGYSAALGSGDCAVAFDAVATRSTWRPVAGAAGLALYACAIFLSARVLRRWCASIGMDPRHAGQLCFIPYWTGAIVLVAGAIPNPAGHIYILTSAAATGFGAMSGLVLVGKLLARDPDRATAVAAPPPLRLGRGWTTAAVALLLVFVLGFGPGIAL